MWQSILFLFLCAEMLLLGGEAKRGICLNMIVKNEKGVIERCLNSVKPLIDYWVIVDTGSTDGTQEVILQCLQGIPGELHNRPWVNFSHNRNEALRLAKEKGRYLLFIDADEELLIPPTFTKEALCLDFYLGIIRLPKIDYHRALFIKSALDWEWEGALHEHLECKSPTQGAILDQVVVRSSLDEGFRAKNARKYLDDAAVLEEELKKDPDNARNLFYLGQAYLQGGKVEESRKAFLRRTQMGGWDQEVFWAYYAIGLCNELLEESFDTSLEAYCKAYEYRPTRAEPILRIAQLFFTRGNFYLAYILSRYGLSMPQPLDSIYVEKWVYDYGLLFSLCNAAAEMGKCEEALTGYRSILAKGDLPDSVRREVEVNLKVVQQRMEGK